MLNQNSESDYTGLNKTVITSIPVWNTTASGTKPRWTGLLGENAFYATME